ncbi:uncharacterized protein Eint_110580 [Encephalitozoon intestinalis ATCC 50506]|uniref:Uncharacterized protein n=1 Tax=Encephalitozoon intestinalis (strain ATCC 50506) TaxID=876142 RepID=E0SAD3_ENCIT|nr:uncharacterized protein Eint_110580 [Encephalitozoon intestinalis ATCC 50506]ADM12558.1 hypothetical protein Eint_110580 [Encephalitozoon intestinalis ATCC 50506]UTX46414.1 hypothetical protein GPK93_11g20210 [Encephalitozoon intestinalis]
MDHWARNFLEIKEDHTDPSDYEKFFTCFRNYLKNEPSSHCEVSKVLVKALAMFKNTQLLSITYRLLYCLDIPPKIPESLLRRHFKSLYLREYMFPLISKLDLHLFDLALQKLLYKPHYECKSFFDLMKSRRNWVVEFLGLKKRSLARKQMVLMVRTAMFHNLEYFITFFGSRDRSLSFLAFEVFKLFIEELIRKKENKSFDVKGQPVLLHKEATFSIWIRDEDAWIALNPRLKVESSFNFLIHFIDFMSEKKKLQQLIATNNRNGMEAIVGKYINLEESLAIPGHRWISKEPRCQEIPKEEETENICFEYLFSGVTYKEMADCIEI